jgi:hypothetical protein
MDAYVLYLDDVRDPPHKVSHYNIVVVRNVEQAKNAVEKYGVPIICMIDHDLGPGEPTGHDFVKWIIRQDMEGRLSLENTTFYSQSMNPVGRENILEMAKNYRKVKYGQHDSRPLENHIKGYHGAYFRARA